jgi:hypothetical protein
VAELDKRRLNETLDPNVVAPILGMLLKKKSETPADRMTSPDHLHPIQPIPEGSLQHLMHKRERRMRVSIADEC